MRSGQFGTELFPCSRSFFFLSCRHLLLPIVPELVTPESSSVRCSPASNAITDVPGVLVGHATVRKEATVCTGITVILPHDGNLFEEKVPAAIYVGNGFGKLVGSTQVEESTPFSFPRSSPCGWRTALASVSGSALSLRHSPQLLP